MTNQIDYLSAIEEGKYVIAQANATLDKDGKPDRRLVSARDNGEFLTSPERIQYMDVARRRSSRWPPRWCLFLEHDDANRALMGANMQRQAVPTLRPRKPWWARDRSASPRRTPVPRSLPAAAAWWTTSTPTASSSASTTRRR